LQFIAWPEWSSFTGLHSTQFEFEFADLESSQDKQQTAQKPSAAAPGSGKTGAGLRVWSLGRG